MPVINPKDYDLEVIKKHSFAEWQILNQCINLPKQANNWIIYYSYVFKKNDCLKEERNIHDINEIDFLILAPNVGIFDLEVKGGQIIIDDGAFYTVNQQSGTNYINNPYEQAKNNYYGLGERIKDFDKTIDIKKLIGGPLVAFPNNKNKIKHNSSNEHDTFYDGDDLYKFIVDNSKFLSNGSNKQLPTVEDINKIEKALKGRSFEYKMSRKDYLKSLDLSIRDLTAEQETILKSLIKNPRCLISGKAGTGKTVLCEFLYKYLVEEEKKSVIYFTYNRLIAERVNADISEGKNSNCFPIYDYLEDVYKKYIKEDLPEDFNEKCKVLLEKASALLANDIKAKKYDCLIIDEAQDIILSDETILFLDNLLNGGLNKGFCYLFYDNNQEIYSSKENKLVDAEEFINYTVFELTKNCRNGLGVKNTIDQIITKNIKHNDLASKKGVLFNDNVVFEEIENNKDGANVIKQTIDDLKGTDSGLKNNQIVVLFNRKHSNSDDAINIIYKELKKIYGDYFQEYSINCKDSVIRYSTVSRFKGLESDVIIYINDNKYSKIEDHYVAISRAKGYAYVFKIIE